jgi:predicted amidohydrolase
MRVHLVQVAYGDDEPVAERIERVADLVTQQSGADLVVLPELWAPGGFAYRTWPEHAEPLDGPTFTSIGAAARKIGATVHAGSIVETAPADAPASVRGAQGRGRWNTSAVFGPDGERVGLYRKIHRFGFGTGEPVLIEAGTEIETFRVAVAADVLFGLSTCYDVRFPELYRRQLDAGVQVFVIPAAWPLARVEHWRTLGRARAIENQCVVIQCNTGGTHAGVPMGGSSQVITAAGEVLAETGTGEEVLVVEVDLAATHQWREQFPVLADRRL